MFWIVSGILALLLVTIANNRTLVQIANDIETIKEEIQESKLDDK